MALNGHPEVHDLRLAGVVHEDVRRLQVEVHDAEVMNVMEPGGDLQDHVVEGIPVLAVEELRDPPPGEVLHREVREPVVHQPEVEDSDDAGMLERNEGGELALELEELLQLVNLVPQDLDRLIPLVRAVEHAVDSGGWGLLEHRANLVTRW